MLEFREIKISDKAWMQPLFDMSNYNSEEYNFTFCYIWRNVFGYSAARINDYLVIRAVRDNRPPSYLYPAGSGDIAPVIEALEEDARAAGHILVFHTVLAQSKAALETLYPDGFEFLTQTDYFDYVYDTQSLIHLGGKKLHSKRNHINRFQADYPDWSYEAITPDNLSEVVGMNEEWLRLHADNGTKSLEQESKAVCAAIRDFSSLGMNGGFIRAGGRIVAFSMGDRLNADTYLVHIEKAFGDVQGSYAIINQQFAEHNCGDYLYINREDDSGQPGLRKAKQSYQPVFLVEKYAAKRKG